MSISDIHDSQNERESWPEIIIYSSSNLTFKDLRPHNESPSYKVSSVN